MNTGKITHTAALMKGSEIVLFIEVCELSLYKTLQNLLDCKELCYTRISPVHTVWCPIINPADEYLLVLEKTDEITGQGIDVTLHDVAQLNDLIESDKRTRAQLYLPFDRNGESIM